MARKNRFEERVSHILIKPKPAVLLEGILGDDIRQTLHITVRGGYPLEIRGIKTNLQEWTDFNLNQADDPHIYNLEVISKAENPVSTNGYLRLLTNHPKQKVVTLPVHMRLRPEMVA